MIYILKRKLHNVCAYVKIRFRSIQKKVDHICTKQLWSNNIQCALPF